MDRIYNDLPDGFCTICKCFLGQVAACFAPVCANRRVSPCMTPGCDKHFCHPCGKFLVDYRPPAEL